MIDNSRNKKRGLAASRKLSKVACSAYILNSL